MALVAIWALGTGKSLPYNIGWLILGLTFIASSFSAWRREYRQGAVDRENHRSDLRERDQTNQTLEALREQNRRLASDLFKRDQAAMALAEQVRVLTSKHPEDLEKERQVREWLAEFDPLEVDFLRWLLHHGPCDQYEVGTCHLDDRTRADSLNKGLSIGLIRSRARGTGTEFRIADGYKDALRNVLHPRPPLTIEVSDQGAAETL